MGLINTPLCSIICYHSEVFIKKNAVGVLSGEPINEKPGNFCIIIKKWKQMHNFCPTSCPKSDISDF